MMYFARMQPTDHPPTAADGYRLHQQVWQFYSNGEDRQRDFLYRLDMVRGRPRIYALAPRTPLHRDRWRVDHKPYHPQFSADMPLIFSLRVNPVITVKDKDKPVTARGVRHDVIMHRKKQLQEQADAKTQWNRETSMDALVREAGLDWLRKRGEKHGFSFEDKQVRVEAYQQHWLHKRKEHKPKFSTLDYNGLLTVTDPAAFERVVQQGLGPAKGFGCGLFLLRPVS